jgi:uncharacterized membrane protein
VNPTLPVLLKWIHLMATVAWIGGMFSNFFVFFPATARTLEPPDALKLTARVMKRFRLLVYISMGLLLATGIWMASMHLNSGAVQSVRIAMVGILMFKVPLYFLMVILAVAAFEFVAPRVARIAAEGPSPGLQKAQRTQKILAIAGFILGVLILGLSAMS